METTPQGSAQLSENAKLPKPRNRLRYRRGKATAAENSSQSTNVPSAHTLSTSGDGGRRFKEPRRDVAINPGSLVTNGQVDGPLASGSVEPEGASGETPSDRGVRNPKRRNPQKEASKSVPDARNRGPQTSRRSAKFNPGLTEPSAETAPSGSSKQPYRYRESAPKGDDLTSILIHALSTPPYSDCPICFAAIHPAQPTWSCSPSHDNRTFDGENMENESSQCCWTTYVPPPPSNPYSIPNTNTLPTVFTSSVYDHGQVKA